MRMRTMLATTALAIAVPLAVAPAAVSEPATGSEPRVNTVRGDTTVDGERNFITFVVSPDPAEAKKLSKTRVEEELRRYEEELGEDCTITARQYSLHKQLKVHLGVADILADCVIR
ncbi:hypothetical protein SAMN05216266_10150 [Amycolatopsis marina]|uniref:UrcA family protein n=1 Tax=Amycolatopsis marina TaxID=490629 RepID=A0A1I0V825_9PSEU|nr:hypothetical protein [Amycolatopsis marina]SFA72187.1 hypothetical protein SAMN05216266_10150 [Amycolatopsis marina]